MRTYGHDVEVVTDHLAVKSLPTAPTNPHPIDVQVAAVESQEKEITNLLNMSPAEESLDEFHLGQDKDPALQSL